jgi:hypothetical protein
VVEKPSKHFPDPEYELEVARYNDQLHEKFRYGHKHDRKLTAKTLPDSKPILNI